MATEQVQRRVRTLIVDDDEDMRMLAASVIRVANQGLEVVGQAHDADDGYVKWTELRPDVIVLDHRMPGRTGLELAAQILAEEPAQPIVLFSSYLDDEIAEAADDVGVCRTLDKDRFNDLPTMVWTCAGS